jgi:MFS family permease
MQFPKGSAVSVYPTGYPSMQRDLNSTVLQATGTGLTSYTAGFAIAPLAMASFSEEFGRRPMYLVCRHVSCRCHWCLRSGDLSLGDLGHILPIVRAHGSGSKSCDSNHL